MPLRFGFGKGLLLPAKVRTRHFLDSAGAKVQMDIRNRGSGYSPEPAERQAMLEAGHPQ